MDPTLHEMNRKLDLILQMWDQVKAHFDEDRHLFYGEFGNNGLVGDVIELKQSRKLYNRVLVGISVFLSGLIGENLWRLFK